MRIMAVICSRVGARDTCVSKKSITKIKKSRRPAWLTGSGAAQCQSALHPASYHRLAEMMMMMMMMMMTTMMMMMIGNY